MLTQKRLKEVLTYYPNEGMFIRNRSQRLVGAVNHGGYVHIRVDGSSYKAHRLAFLYVEGYMPEHSVDHINRIKRDYRWINLRHVTQSCNVRNSSTRSNNRSRVVGVHWHESSKKWRAQIKSDKKQRDLGQFEHFGDAVEARRRAEIRLGFDSCNSMTSARAYLIGVQLTV